MRPFKRQSDPLSERERALKKEIAHLEAEIERLDARLQRRQGRPAQGAPPSAPTNEPAAAPAPSVETAAASRPGPATAAEPIFEAVDHDRLEGSAEPAGTPEHYNELGVRKYDFPALWRRLGGFFHGPATTNPKLVSYLAAGGIQGLRPLRYEKRKARRRFIVLVILLLLLLLGTILELVQPLRRLH